MKIIIRMIEPILPNRTEQIEFERVFECLGLVLDPRRNVKDLAFARSLFLPLAPDSVSRSEAAAMVRAVASSMSWA